MQNLRNEIKDSLQKDRFVFIRFCWEEDTVEYAIDANFEEVALLRKCKDPGCFYVEEEVHTLQNPTVDSLTDFIMDMLNYSEDPDYIEVV